MTVRTAPATVAGRTETILVNAHGLPLYFYRPDTAARSLVTGSLAQLWPPLTSAAPAAAGTSGKLAVLNDVNSHQVVATPGLTPLRNPCPGQQLKARGMPGHEAPGSSAEGGWLR